MPANRKGGGLFYLPGERMPPVKILTDKSDLVPTKNYPYAKIKYEEFNCVQSAIFEIYHEDCNAVIATNTGTGKTISAELFMAHEVRKRGGKAMYLGPLKALTKQMIDGWVDDEHHFNDLNVSICTGDYRLTPSRKSELEKANLIIMTSEMLNSRCRNYQSEHNEWIKDIGTLVVDESHLLTVPGRGDHLEVGLMKFTELVPNARLVFLSATMPNVKEISEWMSYILNSKETYLIDSKYRPCPLGMHFEAYDDSVNGYYNKEEEKKDGVVRIVNDYPDDKFIVFVHTIDTGKMVTKALKACGIECEFHSSFLDKKDRHAMEDRFKNDPEFRVLVATSGLAWGLNMPARRVVITGIHRGLTEVENHDIWQEAGRAGRPGFDPRGDVYVLLPDRKFEEYKERIETPMPITSRLLDFVGTEENPHHKTLAFHIVSEIHHGGIETDEDVHDWYARSLASFQSHHFTDSIVDSTLSLLLKRGAIFKKDDKYVITSVGKISSMFYYSPFDVADLKRNLNGLFKNGLEGNDYFVSLALGNVDTVNMGYVSKAEAAEMQSYQSKVEMLSGTKIRATALKGGYTYFAMLQKLKTTSFSPLVKVAKIDFPRLAAVLRALDGMTGKWGRYTWMDTLEMRAAYGVKKEAAHLCRIPNIGKVKAERLWRAGIKTYQDILDNPGRVQTVLGTKKIKEICEEVRKLSSS